ncbi:MAG TPA: hypothetical protein VGS19_22825 [Streptosporangiaceae bacterium]|nr:hypothetical protein [Streptosporangiaceae bacterium]
MLGLAPNAPSLAPFPVTCGVLVVSGWPGLADASVPVPCAWLGAHCDAEQEPLPGAMYLKTTWPMG